MQAYMARSMYSIGKLFNVSDVYSNANETMSNIDMIGVGKWSIPFRMPQHEYHEVNVVKAVSNTA